jgi:DNA adenine methylase
LTLKPFLKWAGGKRWLVGRDGFDLPHHQRYIEPFLGGGAVFFHLHPKKALLTDINARLIEAYKMVRDYPTAITNLLREHHERHSRSYYYEIRSREHAEPLLRAAQFIYLNRACWNGLYRVNRRGQFNVPIGTKDWILSEDDDFHAIAASLRNATLRTSDFEAAIAEAADGDLVFVDPPYTVAHNLNGFIKYNETLFSWNDQRRLRDAIAGAVQRGAQVVMTNADHESLSELYSGLSVPSEVQRHSIIAGSANHRKRTKEALFVFTK